VHTEICCREREESLSILWSSQRTDGAVERSELVLYSQKSDASFSGAGLGKPGGMKMKTHKGAKKRFFVTESGKVMCMPAGKNHLNYGTSGRKRQKLRKKVRVFPGQEKAIRRLLIRDRRPLNPRTPGMSKNRLVLVSEQPLAAEAATVTA